LVLLALAPARASSPLQEAAPEPPREPSEAAAPARPEEGFPRGEIVDPVVCRADPSMSYALYLPSSYDPARRWPVLFLLDARSRGRMVAELFRPAAERYGWVLVSSNDSASDAGWEKMRAPAAAIVADALERLAVDQRRLHLGGFSGTARAAGAIAINAQGGIAGVFLTGGGLPENLRGVELPFAIYAAAGSEDFNFQEIDALDEPLTERGAAHRIEIFDGQHTWPPEATAADALGWLELRAMIAGTREVDAGLAGELAAEWLAEAAEREREGDPIGAWRLNRATARDLSALLEATAEAAEPLREPLAEAEAGAARLATGDALDRTRAARRRAVSWETERRREVLAVLGPLTILDALPPPDTRVQGERLIRQLQSEAEGDGEKALAARRVLGFAAAHAGFYLPRDLLARGDYHRAAVALELAVLLRPENVVAWYNLACARARLGLERKALDALERAIAAGYRDADHAAADPDLESLRGSERFKTLLARAREPAGRSAPGGGG
jgi:predicted esterase